MWANDPEMAIKWSKKEQKLKQETRVKSLIKKMVREHGLNEKSPNAYKIDANELERLRKINDLEQKVLSIKTGGGIPGHQTLDDKEKLVNKELGTKTTSTDHTDANDSSYLSSKNFNKTAGQLAVGALGVAGLSALIKKNKKKKKNESLGENTMKKYNENLTSDVRNLINEQISINEKTQAMLSEKGLLKKLGKLALGGALAYGGIKGYQSLDGGGGDFGSKMADLKTKIGGLFKPKDSTDSGLKSGTDTTLSQGQKDIDDDSPFKDGNKKSSIAADNK